MDMGDEARRLRVEEELTIAQIKDRLGASRGDVERWLRGIPAPAWTKRPTAKDDLRAQAVELRLVGYSVPGIARELGVARSTAFHWTKHIELVQDTAEAARRRAHAKMMTDARRERHRLEREERREQMLFESAAVIGALNERDLLLLGAAIYWCEGAKDKPWGSGPRVVFINSDVRLIRLFLRFLWAVGVKPSDVVYRVHIHETADHEAALAWWADQIGVAPDAFGKTTVKRHNPATNRLHQGDDYHGCLRLDVRRSGELYRKIESLVAAMTGEPESYSGSSTG